MKMKAIVPVLLLIITATVFGAIKDLSQADWSKALEEIGVKAEQPLLERLTRSGETLDKINLQTRGNLKTEEWITIFKKLNIEPKPNLPLQEWERLFAKVGIQAKFSAPPQTAAVSPSSSTVAVPQAAAASPDQPVPAPVQQAQTSQPEAPAPPAVTPPAQPQEIKPQPVPDRNESFNNQEPARSAKISLDLRGMDILSVLKMISQKSDLNIIAGNNVKGSVTIYLKEVDAVDALKMILEMNDLAYVYEDKVIKVMTAQDYEKVYGRRFYDRTLVEIVSLNFGKADNVVRTLTSIKSKIGQIIADSASNSIIVIDTQNNINDLKKIIETLDVKVETRVFPLNYTKVKDIADKIKSSLSPNISDIQIDERSNQLIITDASKKMDEIAQLVASLDKRHREVLIEAKIIQLMHDDQLKTGISWQSIFDRYNNQMIAGKVVGNLSNLSVPQTISVGGDTGVQLSVGTLEVNNFSAVFDMLQSVGKTNIMASPRIAAIENKEAKILVGTKQAYVTTQVTNAGSTTSNPIVAESVNFVDVGMKLFVTPSIGDDGFITMKIKPEVSSVDSFLKTSQNNTIPIVRTSESETVVMVKDGITIVIAGLMEENEIKKVEGVPFLCRIPIIGIPFRRTTSQKVKTELLVFLTPHIMTGEVMSEEYEKKNKHR